MKFGIDISKWQGDFNISQAINEGVEFAIIKAGGGDGGNYQDPQFNNNYNKCKSLGLPVGAYFFSNCINEAEAREEAEYFLSLLQGKQFEYPVYMDVESSRQKGAGRNNLTKAVKTFCEIVESAGYYVGIYASRYFFFDYLNNKELADYDKWVAMWSMTCTYPDEYGLWQFGGETNMIRSNKICGQIVDQNYALKDYPSIIKNYGLNGYSKAEIDEPTNNTTDNKNNENKPTTSQNTNNYDTYVVQAGDTLSGIANRYGMTYQELARYNNIPDPDKIYIGQIIKIPKTSTEIVYIVKSGDTLSSIAAKYGTTYQKIAKDNNIPDPDKIYVNQQLIIK